MHTVEQSSARDAWTAITHRANTPSSHACVLVARRTVKAADEPWAELVAEYRRLRAAGTYGGLDRLPLSAGQIADLAIVVNGGPAGVNAHRLDGGVRAYLAVLGLTAALPGSRFPADDWRATVRATLPGVAVVRAAQSRPVTLNESEAVPLAVIERGMRTSADRGTGSWPGGALALRVAQMWRLVEYVRQPPPDTHNHPGRLGKAVYRLTAEGVAALERYRHSGPDAPPAVGTRTADVLARVSRASRGDLGQMDPTTVTALQKCLEAGWIAEGAAISGTDRRALRVTEAGRDALEGRRFREATTAGQPLIPTRQVPEIQRGQWVRISNRKGFRGLGPGWVRVVEVRRVQTHTETRLAHNYEVWAVTDAEGQQPFLYAGRSLFRSVRFQVRPL